MNTENKDLMAQAGTSLQGKWGIAIGTFFVYTLLTSSIGIIYQIAPGSYIGVYPLSLIVGGPFAMGAAIFSLSLSRGKEAKFEQIFDGFRYFGIALATYLLMLLFVLLWTLLLIVPGIIAALSYSMTFYILADEPGLKPLEAIDRSKQMMDGYKWKLFKLCGLFLLLALACLLTLGIGFLWLIPYINVTTAKFYDDLNNRDLSWSFETANQ